MTILGKTARRGAKLGGSASMLVLALSGCGGGGGSDVETAAPTTPAPATTTPAASDTVPESAFASVDAVLTFQRTLTADDRAEPLQIGNLKPPTDDHAEPVPIG